MTRVSDSYQTHCCLTGQALNIHYTTRTHGEQGHLTEYICDRRPAYF